MLAECGHDLAATWQDGDLDEAGVAAGNLRGDRRLCDEPHELLDGESLDASPFKKSLPV
jgi:hypothetical protein